MEGKGSSPSTVAAVYDRRSIENTPRPAGDGHRPPLQRKLIDDAPPGTPRIELTVLLPLAAERRAREGSRAHHPRGAPRIRCAAAAVRFRRARSTGGDHRERRGRTRARRARFAGGRRERSQRSPARIGAFLHALGGHPHVWLGKRQRVEVRAAQERARITLSRRDDGALVLDHRGIEKVAGAGPRAGSFHGVERFSEDAVPRSGTAPARGPAPATTELLIANWSFDGATLTELPALPPGFASGTRVISLEKIPEFLSRELPALERTCELLFAPGFEEFRLELGRPAFEVRLDGALSGLTLNLVAHYDGHEFPLTGKEESSLYQRYAPDARQPNRFLAPQRARGAPGARGSRGGRVRARAVWRGGLQSHLGKQGRALPRPTRCRGGGATGA